TRRPPATARQHRAARHARPARLHVTTRASAIGTLHTSCSTVSRDNGSKVTARPRIRGCVTVLARLPAWTRRSTRTSRGRGIETVGTKPLPHPTKPQKQMTAGRDGLQIFSRFPVSPAGVVLARSDELYMARRLLVLCVCVVSAFEVTVSAQRAD